MKTIDTSNIKDTVKKYYGKIARQTESGCGCSISKSCCGAVDNIPRSIEIHKDLGYSKKDVAEYIEESDPGLGCGNPLTIANLKDGEIVLDLGSGGGLDCYIAAKAVGPKGKVIGIDMTPEMIEKAENRMKKYGLENVEFRLGEIEKMPVDNSSVDVIISNCVINLSPDKPTVFKEAYRVLKQGGRLAISDIVSIAELPEKIKNNNDMYCGCISGTLYSKEIENILIEAGFKNIKIEEKKSSRKLIEKWIPGTGIENYITSAYIMASK
jgi:SAM-dependent methyltransferase